MRVFIVASDEPVFLVPYLRRVISDCRDLIVGVAIHTPAGGRSTASRKIALGLLALLMLSPARWLTLIKWKCQDALAAVGLGRTQHHLADVCRDAQIPVHHTASVNADAFVSLMREQRVDVLFHQTPEILRGPVLSAPRAGVLNRHMSLLPAYRGAWPIFWQFANGERDLGITFHLVDEGLDSGAVILQERVARNRGESMGAALGRLFERAAPLTRTAFERAHSGVRGAMAAGDGIVYRTPTPAQIVRYLLGQPVPEAGHDRPYARGGQNQ